MLRVLFQRLTPYQLGIDIKITHYPSFITILLKIIDKYLIKSFVPPFVVSFGIALFVLIMQVLWVYIDDIMGKGLTIFEVTELIFYMSMTLVPTALPIAVLLSTVMVMGNLAERYELSSFKSAGLSLTRILRPLFMAVSFITIFSIYISEQVIPWANLKFYARFYDIRKSRPTLNLQEGVFNDEFQDRTMRIGKKQSDGKTLENIMITGNKSYNNDQIDETIAKKGEMFNTDDKQFIVMNLYDGIQYKETTGNTGGSSTQNNRYPFVRLHFKKWQKIFDLTEFDRRKTDEDLFKNHQKMKNSWALKRSADSIWDTRFTILDQMKREVGAQFSYKPIRLKQDTTAKTDTLTTDLTAKTPVVSEQKASQSITVSQAKNQRDSFSQASLSGTPFGKPSNAPQATTVVKPAKDTFVNKKITQNFYDYEPSLPIYDKTSFITEAETKARAVVTTAENSMRQIKDLREAAGKYQYEMHLKYDYALICMVFLFIGAPMGAIIQKGGFGMPILVAIGFFMVYTVGIIYCKNLKNANEISSVMAAWIPLFIMVPIAAILTYRALNDYKFINFDPSKLLQQLNPKNWLAHLKKAKVEV
jgi:lipopolysaccharide export system permease protein